MTGEQLSCGVVHQTAAAADAALKPSSHKNDELQRQQVTRVDDPKRNHP